MFGQGGIAVTLDDEEDGSDRWLSDDPVARQRIQQSWIMLTAKPLRWLSAGSWGVALIMIVAPILLHAANGFNPANHTASTELVTTAFLGVGYIKIYIWFACIGGASAITAGLLRLLGTRSVRNHGLIVNPSDFGQATNRDLIGIIPLFSSEIMENTLAALADQKSELHESYRTLTASLSFSSENGTPRSLLITSAKPAEGKSTTALAIAISLASRQKRTLLIDADMHSPSQHQLLALKNEFGFSNALAGHDNIHSLIKQTGKLGIHVLTAGPLPPNPAELMLTRTPKLLEMLLGMYDYIVIDGPPVISLKDAPILAQAVEATVFVISCGQRERTVAVAMSRLQREEERIKCVLTKFDRGPATIYGYGYSYGYRSDI
jgi:capsular exopolysaccharide synthesis family protein